MNAELAALAHWPSQAEQKLRSVGQPSAAARQPSPSSPSCEFQEHVDFEPAISLRYQSQIYEPANSNRLAWRQVRKVVGVLDKQLKHDRLGRVIPLDVLDHLFDVSLYSRSPFGEFGQHGCPAHLSIEVVG